jgi:hypothetical protein
LEHRRRIHGEKMFKETTEAEIRGTHGIAPNNSQDGKAERHHTRKRQGGRRLAG